MTREKAIEQIKTAFDVWEDEYAIGDDWNEQHEARDMAIKALEQKSCEDIISRQAVLNKIKEVCFSEEWIRFRINNGSSGQRDFLINYIEQLQPIVPQQKIGYWIDTGSGQECSRCGEIQYGYDNFRRFCASCGAEMIEHNKKVGYKK